MINLGRIKQNLKPSVVVFFVALPLCLGIALASQAPLSAGIIAGIIGGLVVASLSNSEISVSGPAAGLAVIVAQAINQLGSFQLFGVAVFLAGLIQILFSLVRAGSLGNFFPTSVIKGMLSAIGLILILKQFPHAIGYNAEYMGSEAFHEHEDGENTFNAILHALEVVDWGCVLIAVSSAAIILFWERHSQRTKNEVVKLIPSALLAVAFSMLVNRLVFQGTMLEVTGKHLVSLPFEGGMGDFISKITFPDWSGFLKPSVYAVALIIAIVGSIETLLSLDAADKIDPKKRTSSKNRELFAQGAGNALSGLLGGLPITAVIVRTSANVSAGAQSRHSAILHGLWLLGVVLFIPNFINLIPLSVLAVILIFVGYKLTKPELYLKMYRSGYDQFIPFMATIAAILLTDLLKGITIGMLFGFIFVLKRSYHRSIVMVHDSEQRYLIRFMKDISFFEKDKFLKILHSIPDGADVTIDGSKDVFVDIDIVGVIEDFVENSKYREIKVEVKKSSTALSPYFRTISRTGELTG